MPRFRRPSGEVILVGQPELNPQLIAGLEQVPESTPLGFPQTLTPATEPITSQTLTGTSLNFETPRQTTPFNVADLEYTLTQPQQEAQTLSERARELQSQLIGESAFRKEQEELAGVSGLRQTQRDLEAQLRGLIAESRAIPLQIQQEFVSRGATRAGVAPIETGRLRENAIRALSTQSLLEATRGNLVNALELVDRSVSQRFDPIREEIRVNMANLDLIINSPEFTVAERNRAQRQREAQEERERQINQNAQNLRDAQSQVVRIIPLNPNIDSLTIRELQQATTPIDVLRIARERGLTMERPDVTAAAGSYEEFVRLYGRAPTETELNEFAARRAAAGRAETGDIAEFRRFFPNVDITTPAGQQAYLDWRARVRAAGRAPERIDTLTLSETRALGLPPIFAGRPQAQIIADLNQETIPAWFEELYRQQVPFPTSGRIERLTGIGARRERQWREQMRIEWNNFRNRLLSGVQETEETITAETISNPFR